MVEVNRRQSLLVRVFIIVVVCFLLFIGRRYITAPNKALQEQARQNFMKLSTESMQRSMVASKAKANGSNVPLVTSDPTVTPIPTAKVEISSSSGRMALPTRKVLQPTEDNQAKVEPLVNVRKKRMRTSPPIDRTTLLTTRLFADVSTSLGSFSIRLLTRDAPAAVENFIDLVEGSKKNPFIKKEGSEGEPYYDGLLIFRVEPNSFIQMGDSQNTGRGVSYFIPTKPITPNYSIDAGMVVMAQVGEETSGTQFFISLSDLTNLLGPNNLVIGRVSSGFEVIRAISNSRADIYGLPLKNIEITHIKLRQLPKLK